MSAKPLLTQPISDATPAMVAAGVKALGRMVSDELLIQAISIEEDIVEAVYAAMVAVRATPAAAAERDRCLAIVRAKRATLRRATTPNGARPRHDIATLADGIFETAEDAITAGVAYAAGAEVGA